MTKVLGLITARGGSKGIPKKNIEHVGGKPLITWTIEAALKSNVFDRVVVSTDNNEIAAVAQKWGAEVPFIRPGRLSKDDSPHVDVIIHAINWLQEKEDYSPEFLMLLQPTSPLRTSEDIDKSFELAVDRKADCVISVQETLSHPYSVMQVTEDQKLLKFLMSSEDDSSYQRRQVRPKFYSLNGAIFIFKVDVLLTTKNMYPELTFTYVMPKERSLDVDTSWDLHIANLSLNHLYGK